MPLPVYRRDVPLPVVDAYRLEQLAGCASTSCYRLYAFRRHGDCWRDMPLPALAGFNQIHTCQVDSISLLPAGSSWHADIHIPLLPCSPSLTDSARRGVQSGYAWCACTPTGGKGLYRYVNTSEHVRSVQPTCELFPTPDQLVVVTISLFPLTQRARRSD